MTAITLGRYAVDYEVKARYWVLINASSPDDAIAQVNALLDAERAVLPDSTPVAFDANAEAAKCVHEPINSYAVTVTLARFLTGKLTAPSKTAAIAHARDIWDTDNCPFDSEDRLIRIDAQEVQL